MEALEEPLTFFPTRPILVPGPLAGNLPARLLLSGGFPTLHQAPPGNRVPVHVSRFDPRRRVAALGSTLEAVFVICG